MLHHRSRFYLGALLALMLAMAAAGGARPAVAAGDADDQDLKARKLFAAGDYRQALDIYVNLYAETVHPTYLRNIGRCQQNLGEADKAIASFREYLRKAKDLTPAQRQEIEGYIAEMEELKRKQAGGGGGTPAEPASGLRPAPATTSPASPPVPVSSPAAPVSSPAATVLSPAAPTAAPADAGGSPIYARTWFWVAIGAVAAGTVTAFLLLRDDGGKGPLDTLDLRRGMMP